LGCHSGGTVVFVYGTLTDPEQVSRLLGAYTFGPAAVCHGLQRVDGRYPTLVPGGRVGGRLVETAEIGRLDRYEGLDRGLYCRRSVPLTVRPASDRGTKREVDRTAFDVETAAVYIGDPNRVGVSEPTEWPGTGPFESRVSEYIAANEVRIETTASRSRSVRQATGLTTSP